MERKQTMSIGDVLREVIEESEMSGKLDELKAADLWPAIVGEDIAVNTMHPYVNRGVMTIRVPDASLRQELNWQRSAMIRELNRLVGREVITSIRFIS